jgi:hypothetical protein
MRMAVIGRFCLFAPERVKSAKNQTINKSRLKTDKDSSADIKHKIPRQSEAESGAVQS